MAKVKQNILQNVIQKIEQETKEESKIFNVRLPAVVIAKIKQTAKEQNITDSKLVVNILELVLQDVILKDDTK